MGTKLTDSAIPSAPTCKKCGYDLTGVAQGKPCPECGFGAEKPGFRSSGSGDNLTDAPAWYLRLMAGATSMAALGMVSMVIIGFTQDITLSANNVLIYAGAVLLWFVGIVLCTWKRPIGPKTVRDVTLDSAWARWVVVGAQSLHLVALALAFSVASSGAAPGSGLLIAYEIIDVVAFLGLVPVSIYLSSIAGWASDDALEGRLRFVAWGIALPAILIPVINGLVSLSPVLGLLWLGGLVLYAVSVIALLVLGVGMIQLAVMSNWAISNAAAAAARDQRIAERREREAKQAADRIDQTTDRLKAPAAPDPVVRFAEQPTSQPDASRKAPGQGHIIERRDDDGDIFELAD